MVPNPISKWMIWGGKNPPIFGSTPIYLPLGGLVHSRDVYCPHQPTQRTQTFWEPLGKTILFRKPEKFKLLFPGDLVG